MAADSVLQGIEAHADFQLTSQLAVELGLDYVRGTLKETDEPLPRIPPLRFRGGLRYQRNAFQAGGRSDGDRDTGSRLLDGDADGRISAAASVQLVLVRERQGGRTRSRRGSTTSTNELYRNHLSLIKDLTPEMGRNFKLLYNVRF